MRNKFLLLIILPFLLCCSSKEKSNLILFNDILFELKEHESIANIDTELKEEFHSYFTETPLQIPLYRCVKGKDYSVYIGIPFNTTLKRIGDAKTSQIKDPIQMTKDSNFFYAAYSKESKYVTEYIQEFDENLIYLLTISNSPEKSNSIFNKEALSARFKEN